jgi:bifunctional DNase/RNase
MDYVRVEIVSLSLVPSGGGTCAIVLREVDGERFLPVIIGLLEAQSIAVKVQGLPTPRPLTHDLMSNLLDELDVEVVQVSIEALREGTFYGAISLRHDGDTMKVDSRPSDAIGLAVRTGSPIFVAEEVMSEAGATPELAQQIEAAGQENEEFAQEENDEEVPSQQPAGSPLDQLEAKLDAAIKEEDYERAAELRDEIKRLKSEPSN